VERALLPAAFDFDLAFAFDFDLAAAFDFDLAFVSGWRSASALR
jgi:hypothetical protein